MLQMLQLTTWSDYALTGISLLVLVKTVSYLSLPAVRLPPSPPSDPIIGHARKIPLEEPQKTYADWGKTLGVLLPTSVGISYEDNFGQAMSLV